MIKQSILLLSLLFMCFNLSAQDIKLNQVWESDTNLSVPESVLLDPSQNILYVSCVNGPASNENKNSFIAKVGLDGKVINLNFTEHLNAAKGMCILGDKLYVTEMTQIAEITLATGKVNKRYPVVGAVFLNDLVLDKTKNSIYISDSGTQQLWVLKNGEMKVLIDGPAFKQANALALENNNLLIGTINGKFSRLDLTSKEVFPITYLGSGIDGITTLGNNSYILTETAGRIWHLNAEGNKVLLSDTSEEKISAADTQYNAASNTLYVPTLFHNTVRAFKLNRK